MLFNFFQFFFLTDSFYYFFPFLIVVQLIVLIAVGSTLAKRQHWSCFQDSRFFHTPLLGAIEPRYLTRLAGVAELDFIAFSAINPGSFSPYLSILSTLFQLLSLYGSPTAARDGLFCFAGSRTLTARKFRDKRIVSRIERLIARDSMRDLVDPNSSYDRSHVIKFFKYISLYYISIYIDNILHFIL